MCERVYICFLCLFLGSVSFVCFVLFYVFVLVYLIILCLILSLSLKNLFVFREKEGVSLDGMGDREDLGGGEGGETIMSINY